jgi:PTH1 family peptidyl-tRNA hydrolase
MAGVGEAPRDVRKFSGVCAFRRVREKLQGLVGRPAPDGAGAPGRLIVGLGNPGPAYARHRHNLGLMAVDRFAERHGFRFTKGVGNALVATGAFEGEPLTLAKPQTFMNRSGAAVRSLLRRHARGPHDLVVVYDELDLPLGRVRLRQEGSAGGHNGMKDVIQALGTQQFARLRLGIGRPPGNEDSADFVLSPFKPDERPVVEAMLDAAVAALEHLLRQGIESAMNEANRGGKPPSAPRGPSPDARAEGEHPPGAPRPAGPTRAGGPTHRAGDTGAASTDDGLSIPRPASR